MTHHLDTRHIDDDKSDITAGEGPPGAFILSLAALCWMVRESKPCYISTTPHVMKLLAQVPTVMFFQDGTALRDSRGCWLDRGLPQHVHHKPPPPDNLPCKTVNQCVDYVAETCNMSANNDLGRFNRYMLCKLYDQIGETDLYCAIAERCQTR